MIAEKVLGVGKRNKEKKAIVYKGCSITYGELSAKIEEAREIIRSLGLSKGEPLGIGLKNSPEFMIYLFASELEGHTAVLLSAKLIASELKYHINNSGIQYCVVDKDSQEYVELGKVCHSSNDNSVIYKMHSTSKKEIYQPGDFICQLTSGTNGKEKGVIRTSEGVELEIEETVAMMDVSLEDNFLTIPPLCHSFGLIAGALLPLCYGCTLVLLEEFSPGKVAKLIEEQKISVMFAVPFMYKLLVSSRYSRDDYFNSLKKCISAGAPLPKEVHERFYQLASVQIMQDYGSTETGVMALNIDPMHSRGSVGKTVGSRQFKVEEKEEVEGVDRKLYRFYTKSKCDLRRYAYPESENIKLRDGWVGLGDYGYIDEDGNIYVLGREIAMINVGGLKVDPAEVERVILEISEVDEVVVVGQKSDVYGEIVKAYVKKKGNITEQEIREYCVGKLGLHKIPKSIEFIDQIPKSETGKIRRKYLVD